MGDILSSLFQDDSMNNLLREIELDKEIKFCMDELITLENEDIFDEIDKIDDDNYNCNKCDTGIGEYCPCL